MLACLLMLTVRSQFSEKPVSERIFQLEVFSQKEDCDKVTKLLDNLSLSCAITASISRAVTGHHSFQRWEVTK